MLLPTLNLLRQTSSKLPLCVQLTFVRNAVRQSAADPRHEMIRRALYPGTRRRTESPTGVWRRDVARALQRAIPSKQAHETIERAWLLYKRHIRWKRELENARKFDCMHRAMEELRALDIRLFKEANYTDDPRIWNDKQKEFLKSLRGTEKKMAEARLPGLFPREMRIPTDTPPRAGWNYDWNPKPNSF
ncbi:hypothetical protein BD410DRAFT_782152, partial [Rickenella mellea]